MATNGQAAKPAMSDAAVKAKTGKDWAAWFAALDKKGAAGLDHKGIVAILNGKMGLGPWWGQMVAVSYERARGIRAMNQKCDGEFSVSVSKTVALPLSKLYAADAAQRAKWFPRVAFTPSSQTKDKYFRGSWGRNGARLEINFYAKGDGKSQINVQVNKLADNAAVESARAAWKKAMERFQTLLAP